MNDADPESQRHVLGITLGPDLAEYYYDLIERMRPKYGAAASYVGSVGSATIFPNFSWLAGRQFLRVWHPKGPLETEVWSWLLVDRDLPEELKIHQRRTSASHVRRRRASSSRTTPRTGANAWRPCVVSPAGTWPCRTFPVKTRRSTATTVRESRCHPATAAAGPKAPAEPSTGTGSR